MAVTFHKMHGAGNDFVLIDQRGTSPSTPLDEARVRALGDRHRGIGFDQLLVLDDADTPDHDACVSIWNADGSKAEQCGNGMRAIGLYLSSRDGENRRRFALATPAGHIEVLHQDGDQVSVAMGEPGWSPESIPLVGVEPVADGAYEIEVDGRTVRFGALSLGNPHAVLEVESVESAPVESLGEALRALPAFPESCNVGFVEVVDQEHVRLRVLERGAGETLACGSGASAAVAWLTRQGRVQGRVRVTQGGGTLWVETDRGVGPVTLTGPATHVFEGILE